MTNLNHNQKYSYNDVYIVPQYSDLSSRGQADTSVKLGNLTIKNPILSANMDQISEETMCIAMFKSGGLGCLHRFMSIEENVRMYQEVKKAEAECFISVGVNRDSYQRFEVLYDSGARYFIIDIAHGHSFQMKEMLQGMKFKKDIFVMCGNVGTPEAVKDLEFWGADAIKVGLGGGKVCSTKDVAGVYTPMFSTIMECSQVANVPIVGDGGIRIPADYCKSIGAGADLIMTGFVLAGTDESASVVNWNRKYNQIKWDNHPTTADSQDIDFREENKITYRGSSSAGVIEKLRTEDTYMPTPEGTEIEVEEKGPVANILKTYQGGLQSAMSYSNSRTIQQFHARVRFGVKK